MKRILFTLVFVLVLIGALIWTLPLKTLIHLAGVQSRDVVMQGVRGTWREGEIGTLAVGGRPMGRVEMAWQPARLMQGQFGYALRVTGPGLFATGEVALSLLSPVSEMRDANVVVDLAQFPGLIDRVRAVGGSLTLNAPEVRFNGRDCAEARGSVSTDALTRAEKVYGWSGPQLTGELACESGALLIPLSGMTGAGDRVQIRTLVGGSVELDAIATVTTNNPDLRNLLVLTGFLPEGDLMIYRPDLGRGDLQSSGGQ